MNYRIKRDNFYSNIVSMFTGSKDPKVVSKELKTMGEDIKVNDVNKYINEDYERDSRFISEYSCSMRDIFGDEM